ncbi:threonine synthase [Parvularcula maris]|uniref:Threonine synthase n=1 Tax=Parvularcula maris TaxID=2965077 RepID=A0A9X2RIG9_9PROT|nr:threonine synthase [Parvularcula maris]MCQ8186045.1 threonine synthase [Parvularcula maris]
MRYISTRGGTEPATFSGVLIDALAPDGGLYLPQTWPEATDWSGETSMASAAAGVLHLFAGQELPLDEAQELTEAAFASFRHPDVAPLKRLGDDHLLELFHGPTLAFKDVALQIIARLFERHLKARGGHLNVVVATSGDTGGAAVAALAGRENLSITVLHPHERISKVQRRFMTTTGAGNVLNLAVEGTFDDCQRIVKEMFADRAFTKEVRLGGVNSINWARVAAQASYYITSCAQLGGTAHFSVPTGNFGDVFAGYVAKKLGAPVGELIVAVNENDILDRTLRTGIYEKRGVTPTSSPSMDIEIASNFERLLFEAAGRDAGEVKRAMADLSAYGSFALESDVLDRIRDGFRSYKASEADVAELMAEVLESHGELIDPHTAIGLHAARKRREDGLSGPIVTLATAHPAKFPEAVQAATGQAPQLPGSEEELFREEERFDILPASTDAIKSAIRQHALLLF